MKRFFAAIAAMACLITPACSLASHGSISYDGKVSAYKDAAIEAPFSAIVDEVPVKAGDFVHAGDVIAILKTTKVYSPTGGTVAAVFANEGYDASDITSRYGAALFIEPTNKYTLYVDDKYTYESVEAMYPRMGDTVYLKCVTDGSHIGVGRLTAIDEEGTYTVETTAGEFYPGEAVRVYNKERKYDVDRIGRGTIIASAVENVSGSGCVVAMHVKAGDIVEKGQLLFETVEDLEGCDAYTGNEIVSTVTGVVTAVNASAGNSVKARAVVARICPVEDMCVEMSLTEGDLSYVNVGDDMEMVFEQIPGELRLNGTVKSILYIPESELENSSTDTSKTAQSSSSAASGSSSATSQSQSQQSQPQSGAASTSSEQSQSSSDTSASTGDETVSYTAFIDFDAVEQLRLGMTATVYSLN